MQDTFFPADREGVYNNSLSDNADDISKIDAWVVIYSVSDKVSFRDAASSLGRIWSKGYVEKRAVILVANKTDLERTRVVSTTGE